jgi:predicted acylesterase/phospholipase RssA
MDYNGKILFCYPGGGVRATEAQAGMTRALDNFGIKADLIYGTSGGTDSKTQIHNFVY